MILFCTYFRPGRNQIEEWTARRGQVAGSLRDGLGPSDLQDVEHNEGRGFPGGQHWTREARWCRSQQQPPRNRLRSGLLRLPGAGLGSGPGAAVFYTNCCGYARPWLRPLQLRRRWRHGGAQDWPSVVLWASPGKAAYGEFRRHQGYLVQGSQGGQETVLWKCFLSFLERES